MTTVIRWLVAAILPLGSLQAQTGIGTMSPNSTLDVRGAMALSVKVFSSDVVADNTQQVYIFNGTSPATVTLPSAVACKGRVYWIKNASTTVPTPVLTIQPAGAQTIDGNSSARADEPYEVSRLVSDGNNWTVFSENIPVRKSSSNGSGWYQGGNAVSALKTVGTRSNLDMAFLTNGLERMRLSTSGWLGVGSNAPAGRLHFVNDNDDAGNDYIFDDYGTTNTAGFFVRKSRGTIAAPQNLQAGDVIAQLRFSPRYNNSVTRIDGSGLDAYYQGDGTTAQTDLRFFSSGTEQMRVDTSGNTAIGTTAFNNGNPEKLVVDAGNTSSYNVISGKGSVDNYLQLNIRNASNGGNASSDIVATSDNGDESTNYVDMGINSGAYTSTTYPVISGTSTSYLYATGNDFVMGNGSAGSDLIFFTNAYTAASERMRLLSTGNVGIGTSTPADKLSVAGILSPASDNTYSLGRSGAMWSAVWSAGGTIQTSDARLKKDIEPLVTDTSSFLQLQPISYRWKKESSGPVKIGFAAQQLKQILPQVVATDTTTGVMGVNYGEVVPALISVLHQQQAKLAELTTRLGELEKMVH